MDMDPGLTISHEPAVDSAAARAHFETGRRKRLALSVARTARIASRDTIFAEGEAATEFFQIVEGVVMVLRHLPGDRRQILDIAGRGRFIGLTAGRDHDCTAVALQDTKVIPYPREGTQTHSPRPDLQKVMFDEIHRLRDLATSLGRKTAAERLAGFLLSMVDEKAETPFSLVLPVSRQEMADCLGLVIETVCRNLTGLKRSGLISLEGQSGLVILDPEGLQRVAGV
jgi:CRP-like cAMP-binding protein